MIWFRSPNPYSQLRSFLIHATKQKSYAKRSTLAMTNQRESRDYAVVSHKLKKYFIQFHFFLDEVKQLTMAPGSASSSPNCSAKLDTACVTLSTVNVSLYVNQWFWGISQ